MTRLADRISEIVMREGTLGKSRLSLASGFSVQTIEKVLRGSSPKPETAFKLAVAAGFSEKEAERIATEHASKKAKERLQA